MNFSLAKLAKYKQVVGIAIAALVLTVIFAPLQNANAFTLTTALPDATNNVSTQSLSGERFTLSINVKPSEHISIASIDTIIDNGQPSVAKTTFTVSGNTAQYSSGYRGIIKNNTLTLSLPSSPRYGYAYGFGLVSNGITGPTGYSYSIPYSYAFIAGNSGGYANPVGNNISGFIGPATITITGYVNTALLPAGSGHTLGIVVNTGAGVNPSQLVSPTLTFTVNANSQVSTASVSSGTDSQTSVFVSGETVTIKFDNVLSPGLAAFERSTISSLQTRFASIWQSILSPISASFNVGSSTAHTAGKIYDVDVSAFPHTGFIYVTLQYDPTSLPSGMSESDVKFFHWNGSAWEDATFSVDTVANTVTGKLPSLSPVVAGYVSTSSSTPTTIIGGGGGGGSVIVNQVLPQSYFDNNPLAKLQIKGSSTFKDLAGTVLTSGKVGQQINIGATFHNYQSVSQNYAMIVQIIDKNGFTSDLGWVTGTVDSGKDVDGSRSWTIEDTGSYTVKIFVWDGVSNSPIPLSEATTQYFSASQ